MRGAVVVERDLAVVVLRGVSKVGVGAAVAGAAGDDVGDGWAGSAGATVVVVDGSSTGGSGLLPATRAAGEEVVRIGASQHRALHAIHQVLGWVGRPRIAGAPRRRRPPGSG